MAGSGAMDDCAIATEWTEDGGPPNGTYMPYALDPEHAERLWTPSADLTGRR